MTSTVELKKSLTAHEKNLETKKAIIRRIETDYSGKISVTYGLKHGCKSFTESYRNKELLLSSLYSQTIAEPPCIDELIDCEVDVEWGKEGWRTVFRESIESDETDNGKSNREKRTNFAVQLNLTLLVAFCYGTLIIYGLGSNQVPITIEYIIIIGLTYTVFASWSLIKIVDLYYGKYTWIKKA